MWFSEYEKLNLNRIWEKLLANKKHRVDIITIWSFAIQQGNQPTPGHPGEISAKEIWFNRIWDIHMTVYEKYLWQNMTNSWHNYNPIFCLNFGHFQFLIQYLVYNVKEVYKPTCDTTILLEYYHNFGYKKYRTNYSRIFVMCYNAIIFDGVWEYCIAASGHHQVDWQVKETKENQEVGRPTLASRLGSYFVTCSNFPYT